MDVKSQDLYFNEASAAGLKSLVEETFPADILDKKKRWLYAWQLESSTGQLELSERTPTWDDELIQDLIRLQMAGGRGEIVLKDDSGEIMKYSLTNSGLEERRGRLVYPDGPGCRLDLTGGPEDLKEVFHSK